MAGNVKQKIQIVELRVYNIYAIQNGDVSLIPPGSHACLIIDSQTFLTCVEVGGNDNKLQIINNNNCLKLYTNYS